MRKRHSIWPGLITLFLVNAVLFVIFVKPHMRDDSLPPAPQNTQSALDTTMSRNIQIWMSEDGASQLAAVNADLNTIQSSASAGSMTGVETAGCKLTTDAETASANPPPIDALGYSQAMQDLTSAGTSACGGNLNYASQQFRTASTALTDVTSAVQSAHVNGS